MSTWIFVWRAWIWFPGHTNELKRDYEIWVRCFSVRTIQKMIYLIKVLTNLLSPYHSIRRGRLLHVLRLFNRLSRISCISTPSLEIEARENKQERSFSQRWNIVDPWHQSLKIVLIFSTMACNQTSKALTTPPFTCRPTSTGGRPLVLLLRILPTFWQRYRGPRSRDCLETLWLMTKKGARFFSVCEDFASNLATRFSEGCV